MAEILATLEQYGEFAKLYAALQERAEAYWDYRKEGRFIYKTTFDGETRTYVGFPDMETFTEDVLDQSELPSVEAALEVARNLTWDDDCDWLSNVVKNQLEKM